MNDNTDLENTPDNVIVMTPRQVVEELNRYIVGQYQAKKSMAIALRNRYRRKMIKGILRDEILPKNILMIGPTGVGKTEIARRLAKLTNAPFVKIEATKYTEVGYVGRDVDSMIRDLVDMAVKSVRTKRKNEVEEKAKKQARRRIIRSLVGDNATDETKEKFTQMLKNGEINKREIEIEVMDNSANLTTNRELSSVHNGIVKSNEVVSGKNSASSEKTKKIRVLIEEAMITIKEEESTKLIDEDKVIKDAIDLVENEGMVFIDEIDKICINGDHKSGNSDVSREGVQRDLLPLVEGTSVTTKYGTVRTDHILFIASGAFYVSSPSDLLPELQGRFPIRVKLDLLTESDLTRILVEPESSLIKQYQALIAVEGIELDFTDSGIKRISNLAYKVNGEIENIGARRLHTMLERILEEISFEATEMKKGSKVVIDDKYVDQHLGDLVTDKNDLSKFIL